MLVDAPDGLLEDARVLALLEHAPCDVGVRRGRRGARDGPVLVPFAGAEHDWAAVELGAWLARARVAAAAGRRHTGAGGRDASRLLANASLAVQRALGVAAEPRARRARAGGARRGGARGRRRRRRPHGSLAPRGPRARAHRPGDAPATADAARAARPAPRRARSARKRDPLHLDDRRLTRRRAQGGGVALRQGWAPGPGGGPPERSPPKRLLDVVARCGQAQRRLAVRGRRTATRWMSRTACRLGRACGAVREARARAPASAPQQPGRRPRRTVASSAEDEPPSRRSTPMTADGPRSRRKPGERSGERRTVVARAHGVGGRRNGARCADDPVERAAERRTSARPRERRPTSSKRAGSSVASRARREDGAAPSSERDERSDAVGRVPRASRRRDRRPAPVAVTRRRSCRRARRTRPRRRPRSPSPGRRSSARRPPAASRVVVGVRAEPRRTLRVVGREAEQVRRGSRA